MLESRSTAEVLVTDSPELPVVFVQDDVLAAAHLLRENGPQWRQTALSMLKGLGFEDPRSVFLRALREGIVHSHRFGPDVGLDRVLLMLLPRVAKTPDDSFTLNWSEELAVLHEVYQRVTTEDAMFHIGLHRDLTDPNVEIIRDLLKGHGFIQTKKDVWVVQEKVSLRETESRNDFHQRLLAVLDKLKTATIAEIKNEVPESIAQIRRGLLHLCKSKLVSKIGDGRTAMFFLKSTTH